MQELGPKMYSEDELKLIRAISPKWFEIIHKTEINPVSLYSCLFEEAFRENMSSDIPAVRALRRVAIALHECKIYRMTPEFDKLCKF